jgi:hypothetical protein
MECSKETCSPIRAEQVFFYAYKTIVALIIVACRAFIEVIFYCRLPGNKLFSYFGNVHNIPPFSFAFILTY